MYKNLLIQSIKLLPRKKLTRFCEFVKSPYFNKHAEVTALITYLNGLYPRFPEVKCQRQVIHKAIFPNQQHNQQKLAVVFSYGMRLFEQFLRTEQIKSQGLLNDATLLIRQVREKKYTLLLKKYYKENYNGVNNYNDNISTRLTYLKEMDQAAMHLSDYKHSFLEDRQQVLDDFYLLEKLRDGCELIQRSRSLKKEYQASAALLLVLDKLCSETQFETLSPSIQLYFQIYRMLETNDQSMFEQTSIFLQQADPQIAARDIGTAFNHLQNFCIRQINEGQKHFLAKLFGIYQLQLDKNLLNTGAYLAEWHYKNIVTTAIRLEHFEWVLNFIKRYKKQLNPEVQDNAYQYNLAVYYYAIGEYNEVLGLLLKVEYTDLRYNLDAKSLLLKTYYDMEEEDAFISMTDAFRQFLKRNKELNTFQKDGYYNLLKFARSAFRLKMNKRVTSQQKWNASLARLKKAIKASATVFNLGWLHEKIDLL